MTNDSSFDLSGWTVPEAGYHPVMGKHILLVDDQEDVRLTIRLLLSVDEHTVVEAKNGLEALELYAPGKFDMVVTDFVMPEMKGDEMAARIKDLCPWQPILMITGSSGELVPRGLRVDALLEKPFNFASLRSVLANLMGANQGSVGSDEKALSDFS
jgi:CheY-like chemotaxis protein